MRSSHEDKDSHTHTNAFKSTSSTEANNRNISGEQAMFKPHTRAESERGEGNRIDFK